MPINLGSPAIARLYRGSDPVSAVYLGSTLVYSATSAFDPVSLFSGTDTGWVYDLTDMSTLFQDAAGTIPVTAFEQPVGRQLDKSGRGNHRTQATALNRPTYLQDEAGRPYLSYDGINDSLATAAFAWETDKATICTGVRKLRDTVQEMLVERSANTNNFAGTFYLLNGTGAVAGPRYATLSRGSSSATTAQTAVSAASFAAPISSVVTGIHDIAGDLSTIRVNGAQSGTQGTADKGAGDFGNHQTFFGARAGSSVFFSGREYSTVGINRLLTAGELSSLETWTAARTGVAL